MNWEHGYIVGKAGKPHTSCPFRQWGLHARRYYFWIAEWKRGRKDRLAKKRRVA